MAKDDRRWAIAGALEEYFEGIRTGEVEAIPFDRNVQFDGVLLQDPILGEQEVQEFLAGMSENIASIKVHRTIIDGDKACAIITWRMTSGIEIDLCDYFHFKAGRIAYLRPFFDPRPLFREQPGR